MEPGPVAWWGHIAPLPVITRSSEGPGGGGSRLPVSRSFIHRLGPAAGENACPRRELRVLTGVRSQEAV
ncbi:hypothetical protein NDU88_007168 [Pleurodeles waltl]|uniref:Uncharacterized protein n=1 Tax=Pleurodeles waltl TaxID=8319 RepID=A0AAV7RNM8_PLEWA|nr:hypothetical protein NDU88_007168 [Pleurodeles waltl]